MTSESPTKRRGGQPGNHNAKKNRGNKTGRRHRFTKGNRLGGAPQGNRNARKNRARLHVVLLEEFKREPEAVAWIEANASVLDQLEVKDDNERDRALFDGYLGLTPEALAADGREYKLGLYTLIDADDGSGENLAA